MYKNCTNYSLTNFPPNFVNNKYFTDSINVLIYLFSSLLSQLGNKNSIFFIFLDIQMLNIASIMVVLKINC